MGAMTEHSILDFRLAISGNRNPKFETGNSAEAPLQPSGAEFRSSNFEFLQKPQDSPPAADKKGMTPQQSPPIKE
jgi:hypothetical protein